MAASNQVKVTDVYKVIPAQNSSEKLSKTVANNYIPLTFFDAIWIRFPPTQRVFFYEINNLSSNFFYQTILPNLKNSLSITLQHYPPLAGKVTWHPQTGKPVISYSPEDAVFLTVAESCADFDSISTDDFKEAKHLYALLPDLHVSESEANVLSLQVTLFPGYGFSIGCCSNHSSMDGKSSAMFLKSWAAICRLGSLPFELTPLFERSLIDDPLDICNTFIDDWSKIIDGGLSEEKKRSLVPMEMKPAPGLYRSTFRLTPDQIGQLKGRIKIKINSHVSSFMAVCSYIWTCLVKAEKGDLTKETVYLGINIDCRARLEPPIPENYFGNCIKIQLAEAKVAALEGGDGMVAATVAIREVIGNVGDGVLKGADKWLSGANPVFMGAKMYGIGGSPWFDLYGVDFGWGRPRKVEMVSIDKNGSFSLCDSREGNGAIEIGIVLSKTNIEAFASIFAQGLQQLIISNN
ncbi:phenolic glucoside malonyltransferase 1-like [Impatiens glandulifera]|uniref:phenolic glucoside malonyltransferase 1-like n=1 Tax=Impatiens glandulifera TaxID=253017 RepID=UPI001FB0BED4|nr:phenolic glucoside malonyltransferase 1-like [Impatiens glandulifera]